MTTPAGMTARVRGPWWTACTNWKMCLGNEALFPQSLGEMISHVLSVLTEIPSVVPFRG